MARHFRGGTDPAPALAYALRVARRESKNPSALSFCTAASPINVSDLSEVRKELQSSPDTVRLCRRSAGTTRTGCRDDGISRASTEFTLARDFPATPFGRHPIRLPGRRFPER
jgi:hypothetical protein